jgi:SAM-dependent methyltransferase
MVAARAAIEQAGHFQPLTDALTKEASSLCGAGPTLCLDVGAGTGYHLSNVLNALPFAAGIAFDASRFAARRAARAHPRVAAVVGDVWAQIPVRDASVDLALIVFAPRNGQELVRVLRPHGAVLVVTPGVDHLNELRMLHRIGIDPHKPERLSEALSPSLGLARLERLTWTIHLDRSEVRSVLRMGPASRHLHPEFGARLTALPTQLSVTSSVELRTFRPAASNKCQAPNEAPGRTCFARFAQRAAKWSAPPCHTA